MLCVNGPSLRYGPFFPNTNTNKGYEGALSPVYMLLHKVQPGPVPKYRFFCLSARDTVCPGGFDVLRS